MSKSPLAGLRALDRGTLSLLGLLSALKAAALVGLATALSSGIAGLVDGRVDWMLVLLLGAGSALVRGGVAWAHRVVAARALLGAKERLRAQLAERLVSAGGASAGSATTLATHGLDELDKYFTVFLPALVGAVTIPLLVGARILFADWASALVIVLTVPLIPVFMALIGMHTRDRVAAATDALARLSDHLVELARGLPVLVGLGRAREQAAALRRISDNHRTTTVQTLRTAFLSSLALELIATISVAVVAVFVGVRLVAGDLSLEVGLLALLLAPECFTPFREIGTAFHASEEGREALRRVHAVLDAPPATAVARVAGSEVRVDGLRVRYANRATDTIAGLRFVAPRGGITLLDGASGAGKSTVFGVLTGRIAGQVSRSISGAVAGAAADAVSGAEGVAVEGTITGIEPARTAWLPQHPRALDGTVLDELVLYAGKAPDAAARARRTLDTLDLTQLADVDTAVISPGELRRLAFARVLLRVEDGADVVLLDEPTAQLDGRSAAAIVAAIEGLRGRATVIVASHDDAVRAIADHRVSLDGRTDVMSSSALDAAEPVIRGTAHRPQQPAPAHTLRDLAAFLRPVAGRIVGAVVLGTLATLFAVSLAGLSGWLIVRAGQHPPIMYLLVAIVGVRFFGIGRALLRYLERLVSHGAILDAATGLRMRLWNALAAGGLRHRGLLAGGRALDSLVGDVDRTRDLAIRVVLPAASGVLSLVIVVAALGIVFPPLLPLFCVLALFGIVVAPATALWADRAAARGEQLLRSRVARRFSALLTAADDLRANGIDARVRRGLRELDARAGMTARRGAGALGLGGAVAIAACCLAAVAVLPLSSDAVRSGALQPELVAVLVLTPLGLIEPLLDLVAAAQNYPALREVLRRLALVRQGQEARREEATPAREAPREEPTPAREAETLSLRGVSARWPDAALPVLENVSAEVRRGEWLVVTGPSGSGKSTLLAVLLGQLAPATGRCLVDGRDTTALDQRTFGWCPQEGHLFDSTLRANLLIARSREHAPTEAEMLAVLRQVGLGPLLDRLPAGLDTAIGAGGDALSGGERQRVAVARTLLTGAPVILVDEPTAHLDAEAALALMDDLREALADRIAVLVTHQPFGLRERDIRIDLGRPTGRPGAVVLPTAESGRTVGAAA